jgi:soluble epoxide hydrolase/lipid-phosphate phosphatase
LPIRIQDTQIKIPALFIAASKDNVLKPEMAVRMGKHFDNLVTKEVVAGHWALSQAADAVNDILRNWFNSQIIGSKSTL